MFAVTVLKSIYSSRLATSEFLPRHEWKPFAKNESGAGASRLQNIVIGKVIRKMTTFLLLFVMRKRMHFKVNAER